MAELNDWQWAIGAAALIASLVLGGWLSRERSDDKETSGTQVVNEDATPSPEASSDGTNELSQLRQQLEARDSELKDAREEAELTLLQLHQVQEELEHYFLECRAQADLLRQHQTQSLAMRQAISRLVAPKA